MRMPSNPDNRGSRLDRLGILLSGICVVHCLASAILLGLLASAGAALSNPLFHEVGLVFAILLGLVALTRGFRSHRRILPPFVGATGLALMGTALTIPHGHGAETMLTLAGVGLLAIGHQLNRLAAA